MKNNINPTNKEITKDLLVDAEFLLKNLKIATQNAESTLSNLVITARQSILKRFPFLFAFLVSFGATATFLGLEKITVRYKFSSDSPERILLMRITILVFTGRLYKKLY